MKNWVWGPWGHAGCVFSVCSCWAKKLLSKAVAAERNALKKKKKSFSEFMRSTSQDKYFSHAIPFGLFSCVSIASQQLNWKINSNLNYWNKEHQESEIKWLCSLRSFLIGKLFLQGILMVLRKDCKTSWSAGGRLIANVLFLLHISLLSLWQAPSYVKRATIRNHLIHATIVSPSVSQRNHIMNVTLTYS